MKKKLCLAALLALALSVLALPAMAETRLSYSCFFPPTHVQSKLGQAWCNEVAKRTNGEVVVDFYPGGTLTKAPQTYDGVVQGMSDIGMSALAYSRGRFPVMAAVDLPLGYTSGKDATRVANVVADHFKPAELADVEVMYFHAHGPGLLHTRKTPVRTLDDMKGLKIRATGNSAKVVDACGGTPVAMSMPDSYQSIRKGIVDGSFYPVETNKGWRMAEVVDYMTETFPIGYTTTFFVVMNKDKWNALPDSAKQAIREINAEWTAKHGAAWDESDKVGREFFLKQKGEIIQLSPEQAKAWRNAASPIIDQYAAELDDKGLNGKEIVDFTIQTLNNK
jgi:TRAP-type C4-dicarboxylate transport system substrate-binding protein